MNFSAVISEELKLEEWRVAKALELMEQGGTVPFIARYRKDQTGTLNEIELRDIAHRREYLQEIKERRETILKSIEEQGKLTPELKAQIENCKEKTLLEDLYAPYKPKKRTCFKYCRRHWPYLFIRRKRSCRSKSGDQWRLRYSR